MATFMESTRSNDGSLHAAASGSGSGSSSHGSQYGEGFRSKSPATQQDVAPVPPPLLPTRSYSPSRPPTSAEIDAVIAAAMANAPPRPSLPAETGQDDAYVNRSGTPLMTNLLPSAVGADGRVNLFVGNLPYRVRWQDLKDLFRKAGTVLRADVSLGPDNRSRGYGTVLLGSREDAARAIDRFNGYTWQTRTLEVRPDRLPPEYEAQPNINHQHHHFAQGRPLPGYPHYNGNGPNGPPFHPQGGPWGSGPGPIPHRGGPGPGPGQYGPAGMGMGMGMGMGPLHPPFNHSPSQPHSLPHPHHGPSPGPGSHQSPIPTHNQPTPPLPAPVRDPMSGLNIAPSPLAGALTGSVPTPPSVSGERRDSLAPFPVPGERRDSLTPFSTSPDPASFIRRGSTPQLRTSRPTSVAEASQLSGHQASFESGGTPSATAPSVSAAASDRGISSPAETANAPSATRCIQGDAAPHFHVQIDGLVHQGMGLGPPSNLHERVVFVSNMPLSMQWQDLKDLLRPAGLIMRADVAQDDQRRPRGYGTALFATESDAARAVHMFNGREIGGRRIRVYLERESRPINPASEQPFGANTQFPPAQSMSDAAPLNSYEPVPTSPIGARLPWGIDTAVAQQTPRRPTSGSDHSPNGFPGGPTPGPNFRSGHHPGPISMPPFAPMGMGSDSPNPLSPLHTRGLPPMTPSMPGFVFNAYPETPPVHHQFLTPGALGPFSPGIPVTSPTGFGYNPFINAAPGGPVDTRGFSHFHGGSAALGTPTTTAFPPGNPIHGYGGAPGGPMNNSNGTPSGLSNGTGNSNGEYFPFVSGAGPESPLRSRFPINNAMPLNARDRLASTAALGQSGATTGASGTSANKVNDLVRQMSALDAADADPESLTADSMITPTDTPTGTPGAGSPTVQQLERKRLAAKGPPQNVHQPAIIASDSSAKANADAEEHDRGRYSLDGVRPALDNSKSSGQGLKVGSGALVDLSERRASFGDAAR